MRILLLSEGMERGGAETHVAALARGLRDAGDEVDVLSAGGREAELLAREGIRQICVPFCRTPVGAVKSVLAMRRAIKRGKYDVLHAHARYPAFLLRMAAFGWRTPIAVTAHARFRHGPLLRRVCFWGDFTVAVSEDIRCDLLRFCRLPKDLVLVIPNGIDVRLFSPPQAEDDGLYPSVGGPCVGFASRMDADCSRGAELLCAIAPHLAKAFPHLCITLAGGGTELGKIRALAQKANADVGHEVVRAVGWVEDMAAFWRAQEICVAVSRAAMEGAATGCAVLLCGNEGYLGPLCKANAERALESNFCCRGEENATAERLLRDLLPLLSDASLRRRAAEEGRGFVLSHLSLDAMVERTRALYARLAQKEVTKAPRTRVFSSKKETLHSPYFLGRRKKFIPHKPSFFFGKRRKPPHLLVGGYFGCGNLGDDAILLGLLSLLRELAPEMRVSVLSGDPRATRALCRVDAYRRKSPLALLRAFFNADAFLLGGGSLLQNRTGRLSLAYYLGLLRLSRFLKKPTALFAAGIGPLLGETDRQKTRLVLSSLFHVGLRDPLSLSALRSLGLPASLLSLGSDSAFFIPPNCSTLDNSAKILYSSPTLQVNWYKNKQSFPTLLDKTKKKKRPPFVQVSISNRDFRIVNYLMSMLERKRTLRRGGMLTCSPVRGLRPTRSATWATENTPKPETTTFSPCCNFSSAIAKNASTAFLTSFLLKEVCSATALINCDLFILSNGICRLVSYDM